jgi:hypothetical protein
MICATYTPYGDRITEDRLTMDEILQNIHAVLDDSGVALDFWQLAQGLWDRGKGLSNLPDWPEHLSLILRVLVDAGKIERLDHPMAIEYAAIPQSLQLLARTRH